MLGEAFSGVNRRASWWPRWPVKKPQFSTLIPAKDEGGWDVVHEVLKLVGLLVVAGAGPVDLVDLVDENKAGPQVSHKLARLVGECRLVGAGSVRRAEEI